jgi:hypothetical protein
MRVHELGIKSFHDEVIDWVHPSRCHLKSGELVGKKFRIGRHLNRAKTYLHTCEDVNWISNKKGGYIIYKYGEIEPKAVFFQLPTQKQKTTGEIKKEILEKYPNSKLHVPKVGCSLHGDIDATLKLENGEVITIAWNY